MANKKKKAEKVSKLDHEKEVAQLQEKLAALKSENDILRSAKDWTTIRESLAHPNFKD